MFHCGLYPVIVGIQLVLPIFQNYFGIRSYISVDKSYSYFELAEISWVKILCLVSERCSCSAVVLRDSSSRKASADPFQSATYQVRCHTSGGSKLEGSWWSRHEKISKFFPQISISCLKMTWKFESSKFAHLVFPHCFAWNNVKILTYVEAWWAVLLHMWLFTAGLLWFDCN